MKILSFLAPFISKTKKTNIYIFFITQLFLLTLIFDIYWSTIIEIMGHRTCYFGSLDRADNKENSSKLANTFFLKGTINSSVWRKFQVFWPTTVKWRPFEIFAKLNGINILLAVFAKVWECQSNVLTEIHNFGYNIFAKLKMNFWNFFV